MLGRFIYDVGRSYVRMHTRAIGDASRVTSSSRSGGGSTTVVVVKSEKQGPPRPFRGWPEYSDYLDLASREYLASTEAALAEGRHCPPSPSSSDLRAAAVRIYHERHP
jgi:hypothetical protein